MISSPMSLTSRFSLALLCCCVCNESVAQIRPLIDDIQIYFTNPTGFLAPGESKQLYLELVNPENSGLVVTAITGGSRIGLSRSPDDITSGVIDLPDGYASFDDVFDIFSPFSLSPLCETIVVCPVQGEFPLQAGESITLAYDQITATAGAQIGAVLGATNVGFSISLLGESVRIYSSNRPYYLVTENGTGDQSVFSDADSVLPELQFPVLMATYSYPREINAGEHFKLLATITNMGTFTVHSLSPDILGNPLGELLPPFVHRRCLGGCRFSSDEESLEAGESVTLDLGNFYYDDALLQSATFVLDELSVSVMDEQRRHLNTIPDAAPIEIEVIGPEAGSLPNPAKTIVNRVLLEIKDSRPGDQLLLHDPNTGNDWVRLSVTEGILPDTLTGYLENE